MFEDKRGLDSIGTGIIRGRILRRIRINRKRSLAFAAVEIKTTGNGTGLLTRSNIHRGIEADHLDAVPEGAPDEPGLVAVIDDKVGIDGVPVVAILTGSDNTTLVTLFFF